MKLSDVLAVTTLNNPQQHVADPRSETNLRTLGAETTYKFFHEMTSGLPALQKPLGNKVGLPMK